MANFKRKRPKRSRRACACCHNTKVGNTTGAEGRLPLKDQPVVERPVPKKRRKIKKPFAVESRWTSLYWPDHDWSIYNRYCNERVRDEALRNLKRKAYPSVEYRAAS